MQKQMRKSGSDKPINRFVLVVLFIIVILAAMAYFSFASDHRSASNVSNAMNTANDAIQTCVREGGTPNPKPSAGEYVCNNTRITDIKYPALYIEGYLIGLPFSVAKDGIFDGGWSAYIYPSKKYIINCDGSNRRSPQCIVESNFPPGM